MQQTMAAAAFKCLRNASGGWRCQIGVTWKTLQMHSSGWRYCQVENYASRVRLGRRRSADIGLARHGVVMVGANVFSFFFSLYRSFRRRILFHIRRFDCIVPCAVYKKVQA
jgi:hypothetical protein